MKALNVSEEFVKTYNGYLQPTDYNLAYWADAAVKSGTWVKHDGNYYTLEDWESQFAEDPAIDQNPTAMFTHLVKVAALLVSEDGTNPEYDRALFEMIMDASGMGLTSDDLPTIEKIVRSEKA